MQCRFLSVLIVAFTFRAPLGYRRSSTSIREKLNHTRSYDVHYDSGWAAGGAALSPMTKAAADDCLFLSHAVAMEADASSLKREAFVHYNANGKSIAARAEYFFIYGTALGIHRDGQNPEGDDDVDVAVPAWELPAVVDAFTARNIRAIRSPYHWGGYGAGSRSSFWGYTFSKDGSYVCFGPGDAFYRDAFPTDMVLPIKKVPVPSVHAFANVNKLVKMPRNAAGLAETVYGQSWKQPAKGKVSEKPGQRRYDAHCKEIYKWW